MIRSLDHVILAVADLDAASAEYTTLLGRQPSWRGTHPAFGTRNTLFRLDNTYLELLAADGGTSSPFADLVRSVHGDHLERPFGLALGVDDLDAAVRAARSRGLTVGDAAPGSGIDTGSGRERTWRSAFIDSASSRGLRLLLIQHTSPPDALPPSPFDADAGAACTAVDHVVIFTADLTAAAALWTGTLGVRESWRRDFPERGTRNLGLDLGGITIELVTRTDKPGKPQADTFWGIAYRVASCDRAAERLRSSGLEVDAARPGLARGTRVTTVHWRRTPTLIIQPRS